MYDDDLLRLLQGDDPSGPSLREQIEELEARQPRRHAEERPGGRGTSAVLRELRRRLRPGGR